MKILLASNVYPPNFLGGAEIIAHNQAKALQRLGHEVEVFAGEIQPFGQHFEAKTEVWDGIDVHRISMLPEDYDLSRVNFSHRLLEDHFSRVLGRFQPDVFHGHNLIGLSVGLPRIAKRAGIKTCLTLHDHWGFCLKNTLLRAGSLLCNDFSQCAECLSEVDDGDRAIPIRMRTDYVALMMAYVDAFVFPSRYLADTYLRAGFPAERTHQIWYGIDVERFRKLRRKPYDGVLRLSFVGALYQHKGATTLMEALGHLPEDAAVQVNVVGVGDQLGLCKRILSSNRRENLVKFWGRVDNREIEKVYAETDALVLPSIWPENQPVTILEAMACGIPAIVSRIGGMPELVEDGVTGKLFRAGDPKDLSDVIASLLEAPSVLRELGAAARRRIEPYSYTNQAKELENLYTSSKSYDVHTADSTRLILCSSDRLPQGCSRIMDEFPADRGWRFIMREWLHPAEDQRIWLHWLPGDGSATVKVCRHLAAGAPCLMEYSNSHLLRESFLCQSVLYYSGPSQAVECINKLDADRELHRTLAENSNALSRRWLLRS